MCARAIGTTQSEQYGKGMEEWGRVGCSAPTVLCTGVYRTHIYIYIYGRMDGIEDQRESVGARFFFEDRGGRFEITGVGRDFLK